MMEGRREFTLRGNGENLIDFMYVDDAVDGFLTLTSSSGFSGTVDFASGAPLSVNAVAQTMAGVMGVDVTLRHEGHTEEYIQFHTVDRTMRDRFGFEAVYAVRSRRAAAASVSARGARWRRPARVS